MRFENGRFFGSDLSGDLTPDVFQLTSGTLNGLLEGCQFGKALPTIGDDLVTDAWRRDIVNAMRRPQSDPW
jgi:hypothetical protein